MSMNVVDQRKKLSNTHPLIPHHIRCVLNLKKLFRILSSYRSDIGEIPRIKKNEPITIISTMNNNIYCMQQQQQQEIEKFILLNNIVQTIRMYIYIHVFKGDF